MCIKVNKFQNAFKTSAENAFIHLMQNFDAFMKYAFLTYLKFANYHKEITIQNQYTMSVIEEVFPASLVAVLNRILEVIHRIFLIGRKSNFTSKCLKEKRSLLLNSRVIF